MVGIGGKEPEPVRPAIPELRTCLDDDTGTAQKAAVVVGQVARVDVAVVRPALPDLIDALGASVDGIRANAVGAVADLAAELPKAGSEHRDALAVRLDDPDATGRATACRAHGQVASPVAAEILRATADEDEELAVRKAAERVLEG